jgi:hypothetical protein
MKNQWQHQNFLQVMVRIFLLENNNNHFTMMSTKLAQDNGNM